MWYPWAAPAPVMPIWCPAPPQNGPVIIIIEPEEEKVAPPPPPAPKPPPPPVSCLSLLLGAGVPTPNPANVIILNIVHNKLISYVSFQQLIL